MVTIDDAKGLLGPQLAVSLAMPRFFDGRTQWMVLSAAVENWASVARHAAPSRWVDGSDRADRAE